VVVLVVLVVLTPVVVRAEGPTGTPILSPLVVFHSDTGLAHPDILFIKKTLVLLQVVQPTMLSLCVWNRTSSNRLILD
jgi:hypothetical protein